MKKIILFLSAIALSGTGIAQLTERVNNPGKIKMGTRPVSGNMGFFLAVSADDITAYTDGSDETVIESFLPLASIKYYQDDDLVFRIGINGKKEKVKRFGEIDPNVNGMGGLILKESLTRSSEYYITPAVEKHFLGTNILDPYVLVGLPLGYISEKVVSNESYQFGDKYNSTMTKKSIAYGLDLHIGLQAFVADLPLSFGVELGYSGLGFRGEKYKHVEDNTIGGVSVNQTYYTFKDDKLNTKYSSLKSNSFSSGGNIRFSVSYYFNK
jgi:hypothetical protein